MLRLGQHGTEAGLETQVTSATSVVPYEASPSVVLTAAETPPRFAPFASVPSRRLAFAVACPAKGQGFRVWFSKCGPWALDGPLKTGLWHPDLLSVSLVGDEPAMRPRASDWEASYCPVFAASFAACAVCFSLRAMFRVCHDLLSVLGFGFNFLCDSRICGVVVAMCPLSARPRVR